MKLAAEAARSLENEKVDMICTLSTTTAVTAKRATTGVW